MFVESAKYGENKKQISVTCGANVALQTHSSFFTFLENLYLYHRNVTFFPVILHKVMPELCLPAAMMCCFHSGAGLHIAANNESTLIKLAPKTAWCSEG